MAIFSSDEHSGRSDGLTKAELRTRLRARRAAVAEGERRRRDALIQARMVDFLNELGVTSPVAVAFSPLPGEPGGVDLVNVLASAEARVILPRIVDVGSHEQGPDATPAVSDGAARRSVLSRELEWAWQDGGVTPGTWGIAEPTGPAIPNFLRGAGQPSTEGSGREELDGGGSFPTASAEAIPRVEAPDYTSRQPTGNVAPDVIFVPALALDPSGARLGQGGGFYDRALEHYAGTAPVVGIVDPEELLDRLPSAPHDLHVDCALTPISTTQFR